MAKMHNWTTGPNNKIVDRGIDRAAVSFICSCNHLTPAEDARMDNLLASMTTETPKDQTVCEPNADILAALEAPSEPDWRNEEPPLEAFEYDNEIILKARAAH